MDIMALGYGNLTGTKELWEGNKTVSTTGSGKTKVSVVADSASTDRVEIRAQAKVMARAGAAGQEDLPSFASCIYGHRVFPRFFSRTGERYGRTGRINGGSAQS